jgi:hypothetical protein
MSKSKKLLLFEGPRIADAIQALGFTIQRIPQESNLPYRISIWLSPAIGQDQSYIGCMRWVSKVGWRLELVVPPIRTNTELELALAQLQGTRKALQCAQSSWEKYRGDKTSASWESYLGVLAVYYTGGVYAFNQKSDGICGPDGQEDNSGLV